MSAAAPFRIGFLLYPDLTQLDMVCVPGGYGCTAMMRDAAVLAWLRRQAAGARLVTSVCTGSLVLAAAGLLREILARVRHGMIAAMDDRQAVIAAAAAAMR